MQGTMGESRSGGRPSGASNRHITIDKACDWLIEDDGEVDRRGVGRVGLAGRLVDRHARLGLVDRVDLAGGVAVAGAGAAQLVGREILNGVVVDEVEPERPVTGAGAGRDGVDRPRDRRHADRARAGEARIDEREVGACLAASAESSAFGRSRAKRSSKTALNH